MTVSLRARVTIWLTALLVAALAAFAATVVWLHWRTLVREQDAGLHAVASGAGRIIQNEFAETHDIAEAAGEAEDTLQRADVSVRVFDGVGRPVAPRVPAMFPTDVVHDGRDRTAVDGRGRAWRIVSEPLHVGDAALFVEAAGPLDEARRQRHILIRVTLVGLSLTIAIAAAGAWWLTRRAMAPVSDMAAEAEGIDAAAPDRRLTVPENVTEVAQVAGAFNRVLDRLATALADQRRFMADASHELRTPLSTIRAAADVTLSRPARDQAEYREALGTIAQQSVRLGRIVEDMFLLARADAGGYPMSFGDVDVAAVLQECVDDLAPLAATRRLTVRISRLDEVTRKGDESLLRRLIMNLLANAIAYTDPGGRITASLEGGHPACLRVADTGPGIPASERERIFERFVRLDPARHEGGAGLGLSIAAWIAEVHGGTLDIERSGPHGSVFLLRLP